MSAFFDVTELTVLDFSMDDAQTVQLGLICLALSQCEHPAR